MSLSNLLSPADAQITHICTFQLIAAERSPIVQIGGSARVYPAGPRVVGGPVIANAPSARLHEGYSAHPVEV